MHSLVSFWIIISAACTCLGWFLSAIHQLTAFGYGVALVIGFIMLWNSGFRPKPRLHFHRLRRRFRRVVPLGYLVLLVMAFFGGALYAPKNWDTLAYRSPRVLNWLAQDGWHWITTTDFRMNIVACGYEWLTAPLIALTGTDRFLFLITAFSYALLPGLVFSFFTRLGIAPRVAWWWMWILPAGYCYALQAGSTANDAFSTVYALAALDFGLRARESKRVSHLWLSMIAAGLLTGTKQTNLPLLLPWLICVWPSLRLLFRVPVRSTLVAAVAAVASAAPITAFNIRYAGNWKGWPPDGDFSPESPFWGVVGNSFALLVQNLFPWFSPFANSWNAMMKRFVETTSLGSHFASFENFGFAGRAMTEQSSGLGLTVCLLALIGAVAAKWARRPVETRQLRLLFWSPWVALLAFMAVQGTYQSARYLAPYYPLLLTVFLRRQDRIIRRRWFKCGAVVVMLCSIGLVATSRYRPLFPVQTVARLLPSGSLAHEFTNSYAFVAQFNELTPIYRAIPTSERMVGYATHMGIREVPLWRPFGQRRVQRVRFEDSPAALRTNGIRYVLLDTAELRNDPAFHVNRWLERFDADLVIEESVLPHPQGTRLNNYLIRLK